MLGLRRRGATPLTFWWRGIPGICSAHVCQSPTRGPPPAPSWDPPPPYASKCAKEEFVKWMRRCGGRNREPWEAVVARHRRRRRKSSSSVSTYEPSDV
ncbi:hypothetical protein PHJA_001096100 [Phtheirospermum japonicum]|uniref:Uncharacterized protein n=1 Tax=Phtheirospermum japonicum TaxID=374723 RepID=A0A830C2A9_9LAMI|nr:hypothetical protein PHJA_001096100 [Phtheirospermum japonicum]